jgi:hypothetical protein
MGPIVVIEGKGMRIANWRAKEVFDMIVDVALEEQREVMDDVVTVARRKCPTLDTSKIKERPDGWSKAWVNFIPKTGPHKDEQVSFLTDKRWTGRRKGDLRDTIRRVTTERRPGNVRVYAGSTKIYYAFMVEKGTSSTGWGGPAKAQPFLRPAFNGVRNTTLTRLQNNVNLACAKT